MVVDPPDGRIPQLTPEAQKWAAAERAFRLALIRSTETCKSKYRNCAGGTYDPTPSPRLSELAPRYNTGGMNRHDGPEDHGLGVRCLAGGMPEFASISFRRIVQTPGGIAMFYDVGQGQGSSATSSWMGGRICRPIFASGTGICADTGRAIPSSLT